MKSILEKALVHLLNEEQDKAEELMHQFVIETARNVHESLREGDEVDFDLDDQDEEFFGADDLEDEGEEAEADLGDEMGVPEEIEGDELSDDAFGDKEINDEGGEEELEDRVDDLESELHELLAKFEEKMEEYNDSDEDVADEDFDADLEFAGEEESDEGEEVEDFGAEELEADDGEEEEVEESEESDDEVLEEEDDEDFDDITEAVIDELKKASVPNTDGRGATGGQNVTANSRSSMHGVKSAATPAKPKAGGEHKGLDRETAPTSVPTKGGSTVAPNADWNAEKTEKASSVPASGERADKDSFKSGSKLKAEKSKKDPSVVGRTKNSKPSKN